MTMPGTTSRPLTRSSEATLRPLTMATAAPVARTARSTWWTPATGRASSGCGDIGARVPSKSSATSADGSAARSADRSVSTRYPRRLVPVRPWSSFVRDEKDFHVIPGRGEFEGLGDLSERPGGGHEVRGPHGSPAEQVDRLPVVLGEIGGAALNADLVILHDRQRDSDFAGRDANHNDRAAFVGDSDRLVHR